MIKVGDSAPDFQLVNQNNQPVRLSDLRGHKVVLFFFPKANEMSMGCIAQACAFRDEFDTLRGANAVVLGISHDKPADLKAWREKRGLQYDLISDPGLKTTEQWGAKMSFLGAALPITTRSFFVIDENGIVINAQVGVGPAESAQKALEAVRAVQTASI